MTDATLATMAGVLQALNGPLGTVTATGTANASFTTTKDAGLYALIDDTISTMVTLKNTIKTNEKGIIKEMAGDTNDIAITLGTGTTNSSTVATQSTVTNTLAEQLKLDNDANTQTITNEMGATDRGRSATLALNPAIVIGTQNTGRKYTESLVFAFVSEQRMLFKRLLAGTLADDFGEDAANRSTIAMREANDP